jgi:ketosteroid isomerase-like protein
MSPTNAELARGAILGFNEEGVEAFIPVLHPEVEFHAPKESMNPGVYRGHAGVRGYFGRLAEIVEEQSVESVDVIEVDDERVIAVVHMFGKTAHFDERIEVNWAWLITVRDEQAIEIRTFTDRTQALEAAGIVAD